MSPTAEGLELASVIRDDGLAWPNRAAYVDISDALNTLFHETSANEAPPPPLLYAALYAQGRPRLVDLPADRPSATWAYQLSAMRAINSAREAIFWEEEVSRPALPEARVDRGKNVGPKSRHATLPRFTVISLLFSGLLMGVVIAATSRLSMDLFATVFLAVAGVGLAASSAGFAMMSAKAAGSKDGTPQR